MKLFYGFFLGLLIAVTGAWKDTLFEDFDRAKFFRSPLVTEAWYLLLLHKYEGPLPLVLLSSVALERLTVEGYKALIRKPPAKFNRIGRDDGWLVERLDEARPALARYPRPRMALSGACIRPGGMI